MITFLFGVSMGEIVLIFLVVLLLFGANKIPEFARTIGKGMNEFRKAADDIKREFRENTEDLKEDLEDARKSLTEEGRHLKEDLSRAGDDFSHGVDEVSKEIYNLNDDGTPKDSYDPDINPEQSGEGGEFKNLSPENRPGPREGVDDPTEDIGEGSKNDGEVKDADGKSAVD